MRLALRRPAHDAATRGATRHLHRVTALPATADTLVIGAGPAGVSTVSELVAAGQRVLWVDGHFNGGALANCEAASAPARMGLLPHA